MSRVKRPDNRGLHMHATSYEMASEVFMNQCEADIAELVEAAQKALRAVGYDEELSQSNSLHELAALIAKHTEQ